MEMTPSQRQRTNKAIADYMLSNGYNEALESFAREADFPDKMDLEAGSELQVEDGSHPEQPCPTKACRTFPWFLVPMSLAQICIHVYMVISQDNRHESPLIKDTSRSGEVWRLVTVCLLHSSWGHLIGNVLFQLVFGLPLENLHGSVRIGTIYVGGVIMGSLLHSSLEPTSSFALGASGGGFAIMAAHLSTADVRRNKIKELCAALTWIKKVLRERQVSMGMWLLRIAAVVLISRDILNGIYNGINLGHLGGTVAGFLMGLTELHLKGPARTMFLFTWLLVILVWVRISSNLDQKEQAFSPDFNKNVSECASQCLQCVEVCDTDDLCASQCHQCVFECSFCVSECFQERANFTQ